MYFISVLQQRFGDFPTFSGKRFGDFRFFIIPVEYPEGILGADADTLGAIVGSIAEARWGIPDAIRQKAMEYLPEEMQNVILSTK